MSTVISISFYKSASWTTACMMPFRRRAIGYEFREITTQGYTAGTQFVDSILVSFLSSSRHGWGSSASLQFTGPSPSTPSILYVWWWWWWWWWCVVNGVAGKKLGVAKA